MAKRSHDDKVELIIRSVRVQGLTDSSAIGRPFFESGLNAVTGEVTEQIRS